MTPGNPKTILEAAVAGCYLSSEEANVAIVELLRQIGSLEGDKAVLLEVLAGNCYWRGVGYCDLSCAARRLCDTADLKAFDWSSLNRREGKI